MIKHVLLAVLCAAAWATRLDAKTLVLNVATNGDDGWSGTLAIPTPDRNDGPLASLAAALRAVQAARERPPYTNDGVTILVRGGTYRLAEPLVFIPAHSGTSVQRPLVISAYPDERPILSGGRRITGWTRIADKPGCWQTEVPEVRAGQWYFRQLFVNGQRKTRARTPNAGYFRIQGESPQDKPVRLKFKPGDIKKEWAADGACRGGGLSRVGRPPHADPRRR